MSHHHSYQPVAGEERDTSDTGPNPSIQGYTVTPPVASTSAHDSDNDNDNDDDDDEGVGHVTGHGSGGSSSTATPRYEQLRPRQTDHPLANYDGDDDIYADAVELPSTSGSANSSSNNQSGTRTTNEQPVPYSPPSQPAGVSANDGVFANINVISDNKNASTGKQSDAELPPPYEEVAQDTAPSYFDTTVIATGDDPDEILVEGMPAGSAFSFFWNMLVSMSFQFVGFLLTYLLHTSHAAKNGSRAGLGVTFIQYGLYMRSKEFRDEEMEFYQHTNPGDAQAEMEAQTTKNIWLSYFLMILGWFIIVRSTGEYIRIRRMLAVYLYSPEGQV
ncbi:hypothetical protein BDF22DRAFT_687700 [Syncephalis plumigaleata]|nr:hypothetical protein BDF22DRAFT_687700 [Syncephalis plumigaleata]